jgi:hypothetical protein
MTTDKQTETRVDNRNAEVESCERPERNSSPVTEVIGYFQ